MTEQSNLEIEKRRNWKAQTFPYDHYIPDESRECTYCLTDKQAEILRGIIEPLGWGTRWWSDTQEIDKDTIESFRDDLIRRLMMGCCCGDNDGTLSRWSPQGHYQTSSDGGETWQDTPTSDPRNPQPMYPEMFPEDVVDERCTGADSIVTLVQAQLVDALEDDATAAEIMGIVIATLTVFFGALLPTVIGALVVAIFGAVAAGIVALTVPAFKAAMTSDVFTRFRCNLFDNMALDASFTQEQVDLVYDRIGVEETGIALAEPANNT